MLVCVYSQSDCLPQGEGVHPGALADAGRFLLLGEAPHRVQPPPHLQAQKEERLQPDRPQTKQDGVMKRSCLVLVRIQFENYPIFSNKQI